MCTTTPRTAPAPKKKIVDIQPNKTNAPKPLIPFPAAAYALNAAPDANLQTALDNAVASAKNSGKLGPGAKVPFSMIFLAQDGNHLYAGTKNTGYADTDMYFSASLLKVVAMYAAFELRAAMNRFAKAKGAGYASTDDTGFFNDAQTLFDPFIKATALPEVQNMSQQLGNTYSAKGFGPLPAYQAIFTVAGLGTANTVVNFKTNGGSGPNEFLENLAITIQDSADAPQSAGLIAGLSYSYINAVMIKAGFLDTTSTANGMWLGGDYSQGVDPFIDYKLGTNVNIAQVTNTLQISRFFALINLGLLVPEDIINGMKILLSSDNSSFLIAYVKPKITDFSMSLRKIGVANGGSVVYSEGGIASWTDTTKFTDRGFTGEIALCWQNLKPFTDSDHQFNGIAAVIRQTVQHFLA